MSKADCVITDYQTAIKVDDGIGATLKKKILIEESDLTQEEKENLEKMKPKGIKQ